MADAIRGSEYNPKRISRGKTYAMFAVVDRAGSVLFGRDGEQ
jgi:hypothetical protein